jgi:hypothetical protein
MYTSSIEQDTYTPTWSTLWEAPAGTWMSGSETIQVFDSDLAIDDPATPVGALQLSEQDFEQGYVSFVNWGGVDTITFVVQKKP